MQSFIYDIGQLGLGTLFLKLFKIRFIFDILVFYCDLFDFKLYSIYQNDEFNIIIVELNKISKRGDSWVTSKKLFEIPKFLVNWNIKNQIIFNRTSLFCELFHLI